MCSVQAVLVYLFLSLGPVFPRLWLGMLSSLLAVLSSLAAPEPKQLLVLAELAELTGVTGGGVPAAQLLRGRADVTLPRAPQAMESVNTWAWDVHFNEVFEFSPCCPAGPMSGSATAPDNHILCPCGAAQLSG